MALWGKKQDDKKAEPPVATPPPAAAPPAAPPAAASGGQETAKPSPVLQPEEAQKRVQATAQLLLKFGEIVSVLMRSPQHRALNLAALESLIIPPLLSGQFLVAEASSKAQGFVAPVATALWAMVSAEVDKRLSNDLDKPITLAPSEWKSGDIAWLIVLAGDARLIAPMVQGLQKTALAGKPLKMRVTGKDGKVVVGTFSGDSPPSA